MDQDQESDKYAVDDLKERLKKWQMEKQTRGKAPPKRPFVQTNKPVHDVRKPTKTVFTKLHTTKPSTSNAVPTKPTAIVKPRTQDKSISNQENEQLKKKLEDWKKKKIEEKQQRKEQNRRLTFIPTSRNVLLPSAANLTKLPKPGPSKPSTGINRRQTIILTNPTTTKTPTARTPLYPTTGSTTVLAVRSQPRKVQQVVRKHTQQSSGRRERRRESPCVVSKVTGRRVIGRKRLSMEASCPKSSPGASKVSATSTTAMNSSATNITQRLAMPVTHRTTKLANAGASKVSVGGTGSRILVSSVGHQPSVGLRTRQSTIHAAKPISATVRTPRHSVKRQPQRNAAGVKCLSVTVPGSKSARVCESSKQRSVSSSTLPMPEHVRPIDDKLRQLPSSAHISKKPDTRKSILKPQNVGVTEAIPNVSAVAELDIEKTPPVEAKGTGVRFTIGAGGTPNKPCTPRTPRTGSKRRSTVGMTPEMARRKKLNEWLAAKGKTPSRFRHLCCFDEQVSAKKKKSVVHTQAGLSADELSKQQSLLDEEGRCAKLTPAEPVITIRPCNVRRESTHSELVVDAWLAYELRSMLDECTQLFEAGCPSESVIGWLDDIAAHFPRASTNSAYWICRATIVEEAGDDHATVDLYEQACRHNAQPAAELAEALKKFVVRMEARAQKAKKDAQTPRSSRNRQVQAENSFASSSIKFCISNTTPFFKKLHRRADMEGTPINFITPVRRSTRRSIVNLPEMLRDHDVILESLDDVPTMDRATTMFLPNDAISDESDEQMGEDLIKPSSEPLERSLTAELYAAVDDGMDFQGM